MTEANEFKKIGRLKPNQRGRLGKHLEVFDVSDHKHRECSGFVDLPPFPPTFLSTLSPSNQPARPGRLPITTEAGATPQHVDILHAIDRHPSR